MMKRRIIPALLGLLASSLIAAEFRPYPESAITAEQWQAYFDIVQLQFGDTREVLADLQLVMFWDESTLTNYVFTLPGNPAHPAWVARQAVERDGAISVEQVGFFAGDEEPFADLFDAYSDLTEELRAGFEPQD